ncbi:hypothetical protein BD410DRAFT_104501 [Rickenella mellea]|uniref:Uncharacterized protein n=1 Tax=Rickenella mellea TaxID=50990 RepID=A0A4Y7PJ98_9AGAM|nr:hypothetical protein BD410DRAFT_104501 [Rickenella mellea]
MTADCTKRIHPFDPPLPTSETLYARIQVNTSRVYSSNMSDPFHRWNHPSGHTPPAVLISFLARIALWNIAPPKPSSPKLSLTCLLWHPICFVIFVVVLSHPHRCLCLSNVKKQKFAP